MQDSQTDSSYDDLFNDSIFHASRVQGARSVSDRHPKPLTKMRNYVDFGGQIAVDRSASISNMAVRRAAGEAAPRQSFHGHAHGHGYGHGYGGHWRVPGPYAGAYGQWVYDHSIGAWRWTSLYA